MSDFLTVKTARNMVATALVLGVVVMCWPALAQNNNQNTSSYPGLAVENTSRSQNTNRGSANSAAPAGGYSGLIAAPKTGNSGRSNSVPSAYRYGGGPAGTSGGITPRTAEQQALQQQQQDRQQQAQPKPLSARFSADQGKIERIRALRESRQQALEQRKAQYQQRKAAQQRQNRNPNGNGSIALP